MADVIDQEIDLSPIQSYLDIIRNEASGERVRDAIIKCMQVINAQGSIKTTHKVLNIHSPGEGYSRSWTAGTGKAWHQVTVNIDTETDDPQASLTFAEFNVTDDTPNGTYTPDSEELPENTYWNQINVDIQRSYDSDDLADYVIVDECRTDESEGEPYSGMAYFDTSWQGFIGTKRVYFSNEYGLPNTPDSPVDPYSRKYTVTFCREDDTVITAIPDIPYGGSAYAYGDVPQAPDKEGYVFAGWSPDPSYVTRNLRSRATYKIPSGSGGEIGESWEQIIATKGANVGIGQYKALPITTTKEIPETRINATLYTGSSSGSDIKPWMCAKAMRVASMGDLVMMKVAAGEGGTTSTWLSITPIVLPNLDFKRYEDYEVSERTGMYQTDPRLAISYNESGPYNAADHGIGDYRHGMVSRVLNDYVYTFFDDYIRAGIKPVMKTCYGIGNTGMTAAELDQTPTSPETQEAFKIWLPSMKEIAHLTGKSVFSNDDFEDTYYGYSDFDGRDLSLKTLEGGTSYSIWKPAMVSEYTQDDKFMIATRSCATSFHNSNHYKSGKLLRLNSQINETTGERELTGEFSIGRWETFHLNAGKTYGGAIYAGYGNLYSYACYIGFCL